MSEAGQSYSRDLDLMLLIDEIDQGRAGLPNFQRDFDWNEPDIASLLATVLCGWPAGSLLLMIGRPSFFDLRKFEGAPPLGSGIHYVVLDGQQRLTSLYQALKGRGKKIWCLNVARALDRPADAELIEDALIGIDSEKFEAEATQQRIAAGELLPLHYAGSAADFYEWRDDIVAALPEQSAATVGSSLSKLYRTVLANAHSYKFPAMMLDNTLEPAAIARIFERINKTGMRLSVFDLLVARSYQKDWSLRDVWLEAKDEHSVLEDFLGDDGLAVIQAMSLALVGDIRRPAVLKLEAETIENNWPIFLEATLKACEFLRQRGCRNAGWLPYATQLIPLAALARDHDLEGNRQTLEAWLWSSSFTRAYDVASSTVAKDDYDRLSAILSASGTFNARLPLVDDVRYSSRRSSGGLWRAFRLYLAAIDAKDLLTGESLVSAVDDDVTMETVLPRLGRSETGVAMHQMTMSQALVRRDSVAKLRRRPLGLRQSGEISTAALESQLLAGIELEQLVVDPDGVLAARFENLKTSLTVRYPKAFSLELAE